jgi:hypothetical protein
MHDLIVILLSGLVGLGFSIAWFAWRQHQLNKQAAIMDEKLRELFKNTMWKQPVVVLPPDEEDKPF